jgi:acyl-CoA thioesterase
VTATGGIAADTALERVGENRWRGEIAKAWWILTGPYGGFLSALLVRALHEVVDDAARLPRSLTVHFLAAPVEGPVEISATVERTGRSVTSVSLRMEQDGAPVALALASSAVWREGDPEWDDAPAPDVAGPDEWPEIPRADGMPAFMERYDVRWVKGGGPGQPGHKARNMAWARPRPATALDHVAVASLADTIVPAAFSLLGRPLVVPTLDLTIHFRAPLPAEGEWVLVAFESRLSSGGVWEEDGEVWSQDGRLLAQSRQLAMIREPR